ncbi:hypothetical protein FB451DRAFT_1557352 [Mycena latifolia]|nr:hypothetical protein FB451DRAFT_1557352 [Mycena latifolia]
MSLDFADTHLSMVKLRDAANSLETTAYYILMDYLQASALDETPYEFEATCEIIQPLRASPIAAVYTQMTETLRTTIQRTNMKIYTLGPEVHHIDIIIDTVLHLLEMGQECFDIDLAEAVILYVAVRAKPGAGFNRALGRCSPNRLCSMLTNYLVGGSGRDVQRAIYTIWSLCLWDLRMAAFNVETLTAVRAAPRFDISACAIAALKSTILAAAIDLPPHQLDTLMERLQMPVDTSGTPPPGDSRERFKRGTWIIFIEYLEQIHPSVLSRPISRLCILPMFEFLSDHCPQRAPVSLQRRFATWLLGMTDNPNAQPILDSVMNWLWAARRTGLQQFNDTSARQTISEALEKYAATASSTDYPELRSDAQVLSVDLNSPPTVNIDGHNGSVVSLNHKRKTPDSDASSQSSSYHTPSASESHCPPAHQSGREDMQTTAVPNCGSPGVCVALAAPQ